MPAAAPPGTPGMPGMPAAAPGAPASGMGMMDMMTGMMAPAGACVGADCGAGSAVTPLYPSLMTMPSLTPAQRREIDALANEQIGEGLTQLARHSQSLTLATRAGDSAGMQRSVGSMREALGVLEAGIAAQRVLVEGKAPQNLALGWFKREMTLASPTVRDEPHGRSVTIFHLFTMGTLIVFSIAMVAMYFFKMRRAAALFGRIEGDQGSAPPGSAPPVAGKTPAAKPKSKSPTTPATTPTEKSTPPPPVLPVLPVSPTAEAAKP